MGRVPCKGEEYPFKFQEGVKPQQNDEKLTRQGLTSTRLSSYNAGLQLTKEKKCIKTEIEPYFSCRGAQITHLNLSNNVGNSSHRNFSTPQSPFHSRNLPQCLPQAARGNSAVAKAPAFIPKVGQGMQCSFNCNRKQLGQKSTFFLGLFPADRSLFPDWHTRSTAISQSVVQRVGAPTANAPPVLQQTCAAPKYYNGLLLFFHLSVLHNNKAGKNTVQAYRRDIKNC